MNEILIESRKDWLLLFVNLLLRLHADYISEHVEEKQGRKEERFLDFVYIFLLINNDSFIEFTFALEPNKVNM